MVFTILPILLLLLITLFTPLSITADGDRTAPAIIQKICSPNQTHNPLSFDVNFVDSMEIVSQKVASDGFGVAVSGDNISDRVYGLGQCFNYLSPIDCRLCYAQSRVKLPFCLPSTSARIYIDGCFLAYSNRNFTGDVIDNSDTSACGSSTNALNSTEFRQMAKGLVQSLISKAFQERDYYKVGNVSLSSGLEVYGMAQCWRSVNRSGCKECLEKAGESVVGCLPAVDGKALNAGCYLRYSTERFYEASLSSSSGGSSVGRRVGVALGCIFVSAVFLGGAIFWVRRGGSSADGMDDNNSEIIKSISESSLSFRYTNLRKATDNFDQTNKLGQGGYGSVYKGILPDGREIAVKRLYVNTRQWVDQFFNEVNLISQVQHKNLVKLLGCSVEGPESLLVYEYLSNTSLDRFLFDSLKKNELDWRRRFDVIVGTAEGLAYLHEASEIRIIHRDIKASNILLDERFKPKIADFGLARYFAEDQTHLSTGLAGTLGYMAPEYVVHGQLTEKADVYSYGIVVLEVITGRKNTSLSTRGEGHSLMSLIWGHYTSKTLMEVFDPYIRGQCSEEQVLNVFHVGLLCTQASPNLRPPMWKVVEMLTGKGRDLPLPTQPPFINVKGAESMSDGSEASYIFSSSSKFPVSVNQTSLSIVQGR